MYTIRFCLLASFALLMASCSFTTTKTKEPVFNDLKTVQQALVKLVRAENINLAGQQITTNNKSTSKLEVSVTNGTNIPTSDEERKSLGRSIALIIKSNLKDVNEYDTYEVLFVTKTESSGVTNRRWVGDVFNSKEL